MIFGELCVMDDVVFVDFDRMEELMVEIFVGLKVPKEDARICAKVLISADRRGVDSHGINRMKPFYYNRLRGGLQSPDTRMEVVRKTPTTAVIDGHGGMGFVIGVRSMEMAIDKARKYGMGMVAVRDSTHYGMAGYYSMMAAEADMIGICGTNARPSVAPTHGTEGMLGTNPLAFGMPTDEEFPFLIDCATSIAQRGKVEMYDRVSKEIPQGWVVGADGKVRTDSHGILEDMVLGDAALLPLGGVGVETGSHKGYGYSTVVEILSSALQGGLFLKDITGMNVGHFFIAIDTGAFTEPREFKRTTGDILRGLRASRVSPEHDRIYTAGELEYLTYLERKDIGVALNRSLQEDFVSMAEELGLSDRLPFGT